VSPDLLKHFKERLEKLSGVHAQQIMNYAVQAKSSPETLVKLIGNMTDFMREIREDMGKYSKQT
jgi:hypothetical protein